MAWLGYGALFSSPAAPLDLPLESELSTDTPTTCSEEDDEILLSLVKRHGTKNCDLLRKPLYNSVHLVSYSGGIICTRLTIDCVCTSCDWITRSKLGNALCP